MSFGSYPVYPTRAHRKRARSIERRARLATDVLSGAAFLGAGGLTVAAARILKELGVEVLADAPDPALVAGGLAVTAILGLAGAGSPAAADRPEEPGAGEPPVPAPVFARPSALSGPTARRARAAVAAIRAEGRPERAWGGAEPSQPSRDPGSRGLTAKEAATVARALAAFTAAVPAARPPRNQAEFDAFLARLEREGWPGAGIGPGLRGPGPEAGWPAAPPRTPDPRGLPVDFPAGAAATVEAAPRGPVPAPPPAEAPAVEPEPLQAEVAPVERKPVPAAPAPAHEPVPEAGPEPEPEPAPEQTAAPAPEARPPALLAEAVEPAPAPGPAVEPAAAAAAEPIPALPEAAPALPEAPPSGRITPAPAGGPAPAGRRTLAPVPQGRTVVGLDVGSAALKLVQVFPGPEGPVVVNALRWPAPPGAAGREGVYDPERLAVALREAVREAGIRQRRVVTAVGGPGVVVRLAEFPPMTAAELRQALRWEWDQHIPLPPQSASLDFAILGTEGVPGEAGARMHVLLVASPRDMVEAMVYALRLARLRPRAVEIHALAAYRAAGHNGYLDDLTHRSTLALVDLGHAATHISLFAHEMPVVTRTVEVGGRHLTSALAEALGAGVPPGPGPDEAEAQKCAQGLAGDPVVAATIRPLVDEVAVEILRSIDYFLVKYPDFTVRRVLLLGGTAALPGLAAELEGYLGQVLAGRQAAARTPGAATLEVRVFDPLRRVAVHPAVRGWLGPLGPEFAAALGLALREAPATWRR